MEWEGAFNILHGHASVPAVERSAPRLLLSVVLPLLGLACACTAAPTGQVRILTGLRATLEDTTDPYSTEGVKHWRWRTHWVIQWAPVPDAVAYELIYMTSEGASKKSTRLDAPPFRLEVTKGDNPQTEGMPHAHDTADHDSEFVVRQSRSTHGGRFARPCLAVAASWSRVPLNGQRPGFLLCDALRQGFFDVLLMQNLRG